MGYRPQTPTVQEGTFLPTNLLPREQAEIIFDMLHEGCSIEEIYKEHLAYMRISNKSVSPIQARQKIDEILLNRWRYVPDIDEIAVERAYDGDREVWINLTHYERDVVLKRLYRLWRGDVNHRMWPDVERGRGITEWAASVDEFPERITALNRRVDGKRRRT